MKKLKVFGGNSFIRGKQVRVIVATTSQKKAAELFNVSQHHLKNYYSETGNDKEIAVATSKPESVFYTLQEYAKDAEWLECDGALL